MFGFWGLGLGFKHFGYRVKVSKYDLIFKFLNF
jgi:hypothetical protein